MYLYQQNQRYFAQVAAGIEQPAAEEFAALGADDIRPMHRGFSFGADPRTLYRICYASRLAGRVLAPLVHFRCHSSKYLYRTCRDIAWEEFISPEHTFKVSANLVASKLRHSQYVALRIKDAVADRFNDRCGRRPSVDRHHADFRLHLHVEHNRATLYIDVGGGALHRRGYRRHDVTAPLQETVAAAIIRLSGWQADTTLVDPMCGSGTLVIEAHMAACRIPAAWLGRKFGFFHLPEFSRSLWQRVRSEENSRIRKAGRLTGSDIDPAAVAAARKNAAPLPHAKNIRWQNRPFADIPGLQGATIVCNPPHGIRLRPGRHIGDFLKEFGDFLKRRCSGSTAFIYLGDRELIKHIGLRPAWKKPLASGGLDGRLVKYELY